MTPLKFFLTLNLCFLSAAPIFAESSSECTLIEDKATLPILTPALSERKTEKLLLPNGLKVYLISDPGADQSAAALAVEAGSWEDPEEYPGTAHFLEHMLFMGTKAYPDESEYMQYIHQHGGKVNAFTASDRTVYMFSINNESFDGALDRFSHFFIDPLLSTSCINRELHAVDQEHAKNIEHDGWRQYMIFKESANPQHPNSKFSTGNAQTLSGIPQSVLKKWYETHYGANRMHLVMVSPLPMEEMHEYAVNCFSAIPSVKVAPSANPHEMTSSRQRGHMFFIKPVRDLKQLSLVWEVPATFATNIEKKAPFLVAYALNQEGNGSLSQLLKQEQLAEGVDASADRFSPDTLLFSIDITLTEQGLKKVDTIVARVFETLALLKKEGYPPHLFNEIQTMAKLSHQFQSREDAFSAVMGIASSMPYEDLSSYPEKTKIPLSYDPTFIHSFLSELKAEDCIYSVIADPEKTKIPMDKKEKWMDAEYAIKPVSKTHMQNWNAVATNPAIELPTANPYLPQSVKLLDSANVAKTPTLISSDEGSTIYYAADTRYKVPEVALLFKFKTPLVNFSASSQALSNLYVRAFTEQLAPTLSQAANAGMELTLFPTEMGLNLRLMGYNHKAALLLNEVFKNLSSILPSKEEFEIYRSSLVANYDNKAKELPVKQAMQQLDSILFNKSSAIEKREAAQALDYETFVSFCQNVFNTLYTEALFYGNLSEKDARKLWTSLQTQLNTSAFLKQDQPKRQIFVLDNKSGPYQLNQTTDRQGSGALLLIEEGPFSFPHAAVQQVLGYALSDAFFDTLRTKQQTGYIAKAWDTEEERQLLQLFAVQSSTHTTTDLLSRFELFLEGFNKDLKDQIPEGRFESIRSNLITLVSMPPENMSGMALLLENLAFEYHDFSWLDKNVEALKALSYEQFCKVAHEFLSRSNSKRLAVLMQGSLPKENDFHYEAITKEELPALGTFR